MAKTVYDLIVIGGGPAGSAAAITAAAHGARVLMLEKGRFPRHKVCGEFVSAESLRLLNSLLGNGSLLARAVPISSARLFVDGHVIHTPVHPFAVSVSRFDLDAALWDAAIHAEIDARSQTTVREIHGSGPFGVDTADAEFQGRSVIDSSGRWSNLSSCNGTLGKTNGAADKWIGLKAHFFESNPAPSVDLYFFEGGYCGVQPASFAGGNTQLINACAMVRKDMGSTLEAVFAQDPELHARSRNWEPATALVATFPLHFRGPKALRENILLAGDAAGFIDPFVGDGIAIALRSGRMAALALAPFWRGGTSLTIAAREYEAAYQQELSPLFRNSSRLRLLLNLPAVVRSPLLKLASSARVGKLLVRSTRGTVEQVPAG
jgi:flavin-dependent dehydrogenase